MLLIENETIFIEMLKQSPIAGAVIVTMVIFLKAMDRRDREFAARQDQWFKIWEEVVRDNTRVLGQVIERVARGEVEHERDRREDRAHQERERMSDRREIRRGYDEAERVADRDAGRQDKIERKKAEQQVRDAEKKTPD